LPGCRQSYATPQTVDPKSLEQKVRVQIWEGLRNSVREHRFFHDAFWALLPEKVEELAVIEKKWTPSDPVVRTKWLFGYGGHIEFGDADTPYDERERLIKEAQLAATREIFDSKGLDGLLELSAVASAPHLVGVMSRERSPKLSRQSEASEKTRQRVPFAVTSSPQIPG
jgi:hypothetical protein